jgi:phosphatidate cytidylyltransferase
MLKQRVMTALVLVAIFLAAVFYLPVPLFSAFAAMIVLIAAWEWGNLAGCTRIWQRLAYLVLVALVMAAAAHYLNISPLATTIATDPLKFRHLLLVGCGWWALALLLVQGYPSSAILWGAVTTRMLIGLLVLVPTWIAFTYVRAQVNGAWLILLIVAVVASADIGGYFTGRAWGKHKLKPAVSPGKTWEGFAGGVAANILLALVLWQVTGSNLVILLAIILPTSLVSVLGDLLESMVKRHRGIKDSGVLLPGHGGVLDRVDSLTAAAPVFALALLASGWTGG